MNYEYIPGEYDNHKLRAIRLASKIADILYADRYYDEDQSQLLFDRICATFIGMNDVELAMLEQFRLRPFCDIAPGD